MQYNTDCHTDEERIALRLRDLYVRYGYKLYRMSKFEEYDLYAQNKDFLLSDAVITFTDTNGKLMALKPDVTLSIVRNCRDVTSEVQKVCYDENVYRVSKTSRAFREIRQVGLECIGEIDDYSIAENVLLALRSLESVSDQTMLSISQLDILDACIRRCALPDGRTGEILRCIAQKNLHELTDLYERSGADSRLLCQLIEMRETPEETVRWLRAEGFECERLARLVELLNENGQRGRFNIDFSIVSDLNYYNGIVFKGYVRGLPEPVISGGQYDRLMRRLGRRSGAIGFAVYLDMIERLSDSARAYDADLLILYDESSDASALCRAAERCTQRGLRVLLSRSIPKNRTYRSVGRFNGSEVEILEEHA